MNIKQILIETRTLLADIAHWTQGTYAIDDDGEHVAPESERACAWCLLGAVDRINRLDGGGSSWGAEHAIGAASEALFGLSPMRVNDEYASMRPLADRHANVLKVLDRAIADCVEA
ncbi:hypothetical protein [Bradyrhizobium sp. Tv2a-2]|uniref:DUF6197 family protein n=1 Tax=Bradyrhizobium sp. Tv2a-2 TaxID=113395 RepID=UPI0003FEC7C1|nr:hypothetical protein [Bradyrhizobium sp. Tv2a-2]